MSDQYFCRAGGLHEGNLGHIALFVKDSQKYEGVLFEVRHFRRLDKHVTQLVIRGVNTFQTVDVDPDLDIDMDAGEDSRPIYDVGWLASGVAFTAGEAIRAGDAIEPGPDGLIYRARQQ